MRNVPVTEIGDCMTEIGNYIAEIHELYSLTIEYHCHLSKMIGNGLKLLCRSHARFTVIPSIVYIEN